MAEKVLTLCLALSTLVCFVLAHGHHGHANEHSGPLDFDALFTHEQQESKDINIRAVLYLCKLTRIHVVLNVFDQFLKPLPQMVQALASTTFISVAPIGMIFSLNYVFLGSKQTRDRMTWYMISFAIGGLLGDVFFHQLPHIGSGEGHGHGGSHSHAEHSHDHSHEHHHGHEHGHDDHDHSHHDHSHHGHHAHDLTTNFIVIVGIISFFLLEKVTHSYLSHNHSHGHSHGEGKTDEKDEKTVRF